MSAELPTVVCVDDEPKILEGLALHLRRQYRVLTAEGGNSALRLLEENGAPAVLVSDMRMPGMDGATLLKHVKQLYPETTRILLTGDTGRDAAIAAVNEGQIFRYLTKPCTPDQLRSAIEAGVSQHRLVSGEKILLQQTLIGCIKALVDVLAITNPAAFGRSTRVKRLAAGLAAALGHKGFWQLEAAAMLSQIGYVSLPVELVEKLYYGKRLTPEERALADGAPYVARTLLGRVPRMEPVMDILAASHDPSKVVPEDLQRGADILRLVLAYEAQIALGHSPADAVRSIRAAGTRVDAKLLEGLESLVGASVAAQQVTELQVGKVKPGMIFMDDLHTHVGTLLVPKGFEVTETFLERMRNFGPGILAERIRVMASPSPGN